MSFPNKNGDVPSFLYVYQREAVWHFLFCETAATAERPSLSRCTCSNRALVGVWHGVSLERLTWLVVQQTVVIFPFFWGKNHPNWRLIFLRGVGWNHQAVQFQAALILDIQTASGAWQLRKLSRTRCCGFAFVGDDLGLMLQHHLIWLWINTYRYSLLGNDHPFTSYFDVHQGYKVLTHCHININIHCTTATPRGFVGPLRSCFMFQW